MPNIQEALQPEKAVNAFDRFINILPEYKEYIFLATVVLLLLAGLTKWVIVPILRARK